MTVIAAAVLAGCGGGDGASAPVGQPLPAVPSEPPPQPPAVTKLVELSSTVRAMQSVVFHKGAAYLSLYNSAKDNTAVMKATLPLSASTSWTPVNLGKCVLTPTSEFNPGERAPTLKSVGGKLWLFQSWQGSDKIEEHQLCEASDDGASFTPKDTDLKVCNEYFCDYLSITDMKQVGNRLLSNAGAGQNVLYSDDNASTWKVLNGSKDSMTCYHPSFEVIGDRLLIGGECPLDFAYLRAYQLSADGGKLVSQEPLKLDLPDLENRNIQFIESIPNSKRVFVGVEGGLLRSDDSGKTFKFVIRKEISNPEHSYPYVWKIVSPAGKPDAIVVGGFDKGQHKPYLAWSANGGDTWTDLSSMLPQPKADGSGQVTAIAEGPDGTLLVTVNEDASGKGHLMQLTLGKP